MRQAYDYWQDQPGSFRRGPSDKRSTKPSLSPLGTGHTSSARSDCRQLLLEKRFVTKLLVCLHLRISSDGNRTRTALTRSGQRRMLLLGRENVLRCELTDGHNGVSRSGTRRARFLLLLAFGIAYSYNRFALSAQAKISLCMSHPSQRVAGTRHQYPRASASSEFSLTFLVVVYRFPHNRCHTRKRWRVIFGHLKGFFSTGSISSGFPFLVPKIFF